MIGPPDTRACLLVLLLVAGQEPSAEREPCEPARPVVQAPPGWYAGDTHEHLQMCHRVPDRTVEGLVCDMESEGLAVSSVLVWQGPNGDFVEKLAYVTGEEDAATRDDPARFLQFGIETSGLDCSRLGHLIALGLTPDEARVLGRYRSCEENDGSGDFHGPLLEVLSANPEVALGYAHQIWSTERYHPEGYAWKELLRDAGLAGDVVCTPLDARLGFPPLAPLKTEGFPPLAAVDAALGRIHFLESIDLTKDFRDYDARKETRWWGMYYRLLSAGLRLAPAGGTDVNCVSAELEDVRTWVRVEGELDYDAWVAGLRAGRVSLAGGPSRFLDLSVGDAGIGGEHALSDPGRVTVRATLHVADDVAAGATAIEIVRNGEVVASLALDAGRRGGVQTVETELACAGSAWIAARTDDGLCHTGAAWVVVGDEPVAVCEDAEYWALWCDRVTKGVLNFEQPARLVGCSGPEILEYVAAGRKVFAALRDLAHGLPAGAARVAPSNPACRGPIKVVLREPPRAGAPLLLRCVNAPAGAEGVLLVGRSLRPAPRERKGARAHVSLRGLTTVPATASSGGYAESLLHPPEDVRGEDYFVQYVWREGGGCRPSGAWSASDVVRITLR